MTTAPTALGNARPVRAALWARVSTEEQTEANQMTPLHAEAARRGWEVVKVYPIKQSAFRGGHHAALAGVYDDARSGMYTVLLVWALDRLTREGIGPMFQTIERLSKSGVRVVSIQEPWTEVEGPAYELMLSIFAWIAHQESMRRSERVRAGMDRLKREGKSFGRPSVLDHVNMALVARLRAAGEGWDAIARKHPPTIPTPRGGHKKPSPATCARAWAARSRVGI